MKQQRASARGKKAMSRGCGHTRPCSGVEATQQALRHQYPPYSLLPPQTPEDNLLVPLRRRAYFLQVTSLGQSGPAVAVDIFATV